MKYFLNVLKNFRIGIYLAVSIMITLVLAWAIFVEGDLLQVMFATICLAISISHAYEGLCEDLRKKGEITVIFDKDDTFVNAYKDESKTREETK